MAKHFNNGTGGSSIYGGTNAGFTSFAKANRVGKQYRKSTEMWDPSSSPTLNAQRAKSTAGRHYAREIERKAERSRNLTFLIMAVVVIAIALAAGVLVYLSVVESNLSLKDSNAELSLAASGQENVEYILCEADLSTGVAQNSDEYLAHAYILMRLDTAAKSINMIYLPSNLRVTLNGETRHRLFEATNYGGDSALIDMVSSYVGVNISHYVKTDMDGILSLTSVAGALSVNLFEAVSDPLTGETILPQGATVTTVATVTDLLCSDNYTKGTTSLAQNRMSYLAYLIPRMLETEGLNFIMRLDELSNYAEGTMTIFEVIEHADAVRGISAYDMGLAVVPGSLVTTAGVEYYVASSSEWAIMQERFINGLDPSYVQESGELDKSTITIDVRNANSVEGVAYYAASVLTADGFNVINTGNVEDGVNYPETLVVYHDESMLAAGQAVVNALGAGRLVNGGDYYTFDADIYVALGTDYSLPEDYVPPKTDDEEEE